MTYLVFSAIASEISTDEGDPIQSSDSVAELKWEIWHPKVIGSLKPSGTAFFPFGIWWLFNCVGVFRNTGYRVILARRGDRIVHRTCIFPGYFRFPFMATNDLQFGDIWTSNDFRGLGLAKRGMSLGMSTIIDTSRDIRLWYLSKEENSASVRLATSFGLGLYGRAARESRLGLSAFGKYVVQSNLTSNFEGRHRPNEKAA